MRKSIIVIAVAAALSGCAVGPNYHRPTPHVEKQFPTASAAQGASPEAVASSDIYSHAPAQTEFWKQFDDPVLNSMVGDALTANYDLRIALGRLVQARALRNESLFDLAPTVTAAAGYSKQRTPAVESPLGGPYTTKLYDAGFDATWELDFFGGVRRGIQARNAELEGEVATLHDAQVSVIAEVARNYFELRGEQTQLAVARGNVKNQQQVLALAQAELQAGSGTDLDVARAQSQLSTTLSTIGPLEAAVSRSIHRLGVLTGRDPDALTGVLSAPHELPPLPQFVPVGTPEELLRRRADIRAAERNVAASTALVGVAVSNLFPKVTFTGSFGYAAAEPAGFGASGSRSYSIGPGITWAAFDLGRVRAQIAGARAGAVIALDQYHQTVLGALEETEDALVTHARQRDQLRHAEDAARASATAAKLAEIRYKGGMVDFLSVLDAERTELQTEDALAQSRTAAATSLIAVYKALGGGWETAPLPRYTDASISR
ncbi:MAG TPA: efflux transporter outer membrane subunit [Steroidobacteraceae bacterium]|jgi:multidrug efflux system outer membrane protein|nr:efflux transporter outer membrane subunit [Steroidobacteraceae bacterium]